MESRMRGNSHVRFGAGDEETCLGNGVRRFIPTLPNPLSALFLYKAAACWGVAGKGGMALPPFSGACPMLEGQVAHVAGRCVSDRNPAGRRRLPGGGRREPAPRAQRVRARPERSDGDAQNRKRKKRSDFRQRADDHGAGCAITYLHVAISDICAAHYELFLPWS